VHEAYEPNAVVDLLDAEPLAGEHVEIVIFLRMQAEPSASGDENVAIMDGRSVPAGPSCGEASRVRRGIHIQRLTRPFDIELTDEGIEASC